LQKEFNVEEKNIVYDSDGSGNYIYGFLKQAFPFHGGNTRSKYYNTRRSWFYYELAQRIKQGKISVVCQGFEQEITEELLAIKQLKKDTDGKQGVTKKEQIRSELGKSTDFADNFMMRMSFEIFE
jgi:hypothetical protein